MANVLIIEDDAALRHTLSLALHSRGFQVLQTDNANDGVRLARAHLPDLIVSDIHLAEGDGYKVLDDLKGATATAAIPFILITGQLGETNVRRGMERGADDYIVKPFTAEHFLASVRARLSKVAVVRKAGDETKERLVAILETTPDFVGTATPEGRMLFINRAGRRMVGLDETADIELVDLTTFSPPWARERILREALPVAIRNGVWSGETSLISGGVEIPVSQVLQVHKTPQGDVAFLSTVIRDLSDRKRAEQALRESDLRLQMAVQAGGVGLWDWELETNRIYFSDMWKSQLGFRADEISHRLEDWQGRLHPEDRKLVLERVEASLNPPWPPFECEFRLRHKDGSYRWILSRATVARNGPARPARLVGTHLDITERKQTEESLRLLAGRILRLQDEERRRIGRDLHDSTAQALAALEIDLSLLTKNSASLDPGSQERLKESLRLVKQCSSEIRTVAYLLHPPLLEETGLASAIQWYLDGFQRRSGVAVSFTASESCERFPADVELALFRICQEGLGNIHRHSGSKTAEVQLDYDGARVLLELKDRGKGIAPEILHQIRGGGARIGVGLAGMRERIRQLGGLFEIASGESGTVVRVSLPVKVYEEDSSSGRG